MKLSSADRDTIAMFQNNSRHFEAINVNYYLARRGAGKSIKSFSDFIESYKSAIGANAVLPFYIVPNKKGVDSLIDKFKGDLIGVDLEILDNHIVSYESNSFSWDLFNQYAQLYIDEGKPFIDGTKSDIVELWRLNYRFYIYAS